MPSRAANTPAILLCAFEPRLIRDFGEKTRTGGDFSGSRPGYWGDFPDRIVPPYTFARFGAKGVQGVSLHTNKQQPVDVFADRGA